MQHQYSSATAQLGELAGGAGTHNMIWLHARAGFYCFLLARVPATVGSAEGTCLCLKQHSLGSILCAAFMNDRYVFVMPGLPLCASQRRPCASV